MRLTRSGIPLSHSAEFWLGFVVGALIGQVVVIIGFVIAHFVTGVI